MSRRDSYRLELRRNDSSTVAEAVLHVRDADGGEHEVRLTGLRLTSVLEPLRHLIAEAGISGRQWSGGRPFELPVRTGEQVELLLAAIRPLRRADRISGVAEGVATMGSEEAAYWHAKASRRGGLRALRILLIEGGH